MYKANQYIQVLTDTELAYYKQAGVPVQKVKIQFNKIITDLVKGTLDSSLVFSLLTDQLSRSELVDFNNKLSQQVDIVAGDADPLLLLWAALDEYLE